MIHSACKINIDLAEMTPLHPHLRYSLLLLACFFFLFYLEKNTLPYRLKSLQMTLASIITPLISRLGDEACAGIKLFFSQRDNTLSNKVSISKSCPAVKTQAIGT